MVTTEEIKKIKAGETREWQLPTPRAARNVQSLVNYVKTFTPAEGVTDYITKREGNKIKVTAI